MKKLGSYTFLMPLIVTFAAGSPAVYASDTSHSGLRVYRTIAQEQQNQALNEFAEDFTKKAAEGRVEAFVGQSLVIQQVEDAISSKQSVTLIADPGVGKTATVEEIARLSLETHPDRRIYSLKLAKFLGDGVDQSATAKNIEAIVAELKASNGKYILFIDEFHAVMRLPGVGDMLKTALARLEITGIFATTTQEYKEYVEKDAAFTSRSETIRLQNMTVEGLITIMKANKVRLQQKLGFPVTDEALERVARSTFRDFAVDVPARQAMRLVARAAAILRNEVQGRPRDLLVINDRIQKIQLDVDSLKIDLQTETDPNEFVRKGSEIKALETELAGLEEQKTRIREINELRNQKATLERSITAALQNGDFGKAEQIRNEDITSVDRKLSELGYTKAGSLNVIDAAAINAAVGEMSGYSQEYISETDSQRLDRMAGRIGQEVRGQNQAINDVVSAIRTNQARVRAKQGPAAVIVMGPPKTGHSYLASRVAKYGYGSETKITVLDGTSLNMGKHSVWQMMGSDIGHVGSENKEGSLTGAVRQTPNQVIQFKNAEAASVEILETIGSLLPKDTFTDKQGRPINFGNATFMMTTHLGAEYAIDKVTLTDAQMAAKYNISLAEYQSMNWQQRDQRIGKQILQRANFPASVIDNATITMTNVISYRDMLRIVDLQLKEAVRELRAQKGIAMTYDHTVVYSIARAGYDAQFGAGNINNTVKAYITEALANLVTTHNARKGDTVRFAFRRSGPNARNGTMEVLLNGQSTLTRQLEFRDARALDADLNKAREADLRTTKAETDRFTPQPAEGIDSNLQRGGAEVSRTAREQAAQPNPREAAPARESAPRAAAPAQSNRITVRPRPGTTVTETTTTTTRVTTTERPVVRRSTPVRAAAAPAPAPAPARRVSAPAPRVAGETFAERQARRAMEQAAQGSERTRSGRVDVRGMAERMRRKPR